MKAVILAGGLGTRLSEETSLKPKPMVNIGEKPILWHIMKTYAHYGINEFVICLGYKGYVIKEYFINYYRHMADITVDLEHDGLEVHRNYAEPWKVTLVNTGEKTMTGGRLARVKPYIQDEEAFCLTYGDGIADVNIRDLVEFHKKCGKLATLTAVQPAGRFGALDIEGIEVKKFQEKPRGDGSYVNGGYFVMSPKVLDYITEGDQTILEQTPLNNLAADNQLSAYKHDGFWHAIDTLRDKMHADNLWNAQKAPWRVWE